jgi:hypothetical protein
MRRGKEIDKWYAFFIDKWLFGSTRHELIVKDQDQFIDLRGIWIDLLTLSKKDSGFIRANEETPYPHEQLAGMFCIPIRYLEMTIDIALKKGKLSEEKPGIYFVNSTDTYSLSDRRKYQKEAEVSLFSEAAAQNPESISAKSEARLEENRREKIKEEDIDGFSSFCAKIIDIWNRFSDARDLAKINAIIKGSKRERALHARYLAKDFDLEKILMQAIKQPFLFGDSERGWKMSFDWIIAPSNFIKVLEAQYRGQQKQSEAEQFAEMNRRIAAKYEKKQSINRHAALSAMADISMQKEKP